MKVLIVDDAPVNLKLLRAVLEGDAIGVVEAQDGAQALRALEREPVDAIISDILMPNMDGYRLCKAVRQSDRWRELPFIFYSATYTSDDDEKLCYDLGGDKYLRKPAPAKTLLDVLRDVTRATGKHAIPHQLLSEPEVTKEYNQRLVSKLEEKNEELALRTIQLEQAQARLEEANRELDQRVRQRTMELEMANQELEAFSYSVSHDLRSPLNHISGYIDIIIRNCSEKLDAENARHLQTVRRAARRMGDLISSLLELSRLARIDVERDVVNLSALALEVFSEMQLAEPSRRVQVVIQPDLKVVVDRRMMRVVLTNLLGNAWKYSRKRAEACIEFGRLNDAEVETFYVRDNGAGFDMAYVNRLFQPFQRLHGVSEFEGSGIGLATVRRILTRHDGRIWAESRSGVGATFYFTLGGGEPNDARDGNSS